MFVVSYGEIPTVLENKQMILHSSLEVSRFHIVTCMVKQYCNEADYVLIRCYLHRICTEELLVGLFYLVL